MNKKRIIAVNCKAKDLLTEIQKQKNNFKKEKTLEELSEEKRERIYEDDFNDYLDNYEEEE